MSEKNLSAVSTLSLAFIGDGVYDLLVRKYLLSSFPDEHVSALNKKKVSLVNCKSQADSVRLLLPSLTESETEIFKRGRNAHPHSSSKHSSLSDYHAATGLETLFGWLYLRGEKERINELFTLILKSTDSI